MPDERRILRMILGVAKQRKRFVNTCEVRLGLLDHATQIFENFPIAVDDPADFKLEGNSTQAAPPGDPNTLEVPSQRRPKTRRVFLDR